MKLITNTLMLVTIALLTACAASTPQKLVEARDALEAAKSDSFVVANAPLELREAEQTVEEANKMWRNDDEPKAVTAVAETAKRQVVFAREQASRKASNEQVKENQQARLLNEQSRAIQQQTQTLQELQLENRVLANSLHELHARETERGIAVTLDSDVLFETDSATLKPGAERKLQPLASYLKEYPERSATIEGHTDSRGSDSYNRDLSQRRAQTVVNFLARQGVDRARLNASGLGEQYPIASNDTTAGMLQNRRVEVIFTR